jgi:hypothetical protein
MPKTNSASSKRRHDLDNLRTFLTALLIYHHTEIVYGGLESWLFKSRFFNRGSLALVPFNSINQSFFMGLFFWLSGLLSGNRLSKSPTKESRWSFLRTKWFHLGLPAAVYTLMIHPLSIALATLLSFDTLATLCISYTKSKVVQYSQNFI